MRTLKFIVNGQILEQDPQCDFTNLVPGSSGYLQAEFSFSKEWDDCVKVAAFYSPLGVEYPPQVLKEGERCLIPSEACAKKEFRIKVFGKRDDFRINTNKLAVCQNGG